MYNLIRFLQKHNFVLLFVLLEIVSVIMLTRSHTYHRAAVNHTTNQLSSRIYEINASITSYLSLKNANDLLRKQNAELMAELVRMEESILPSDSLSLPSDSLSKDVVFDFLPARVIKNTTHLRNNYIIINKGRRDGIKKDMGIVDPEGVVGIIISVSDRYASAMSLLHKYATLSVRFKNNDQIANLHWKGGNYQLGEIVDIPTHVTLQKGDTIVTSGHSFVFPENLMVGTIEEFVESERGNLNSASIRFAVDFNRLRNVYVVKNFHRAELDDLSKIKTNE